MMILCKIGVLEHEISSAFLSMVTDNKPNGSQNRGSASPKKAATAKCAASIWMWYKIANTPNTQIVSAVDCLDSHS